MHRSIVDAGSLVDIDVEAIVGTHLQGGLHSVFNGRHRGIVPDHSIDLPLIGAVLVEAATLVKRLLLAGGNLREARLLDGILLRVVVGGDPPSHVIAGQCKLRALFLDEEVVQFGLLRELIAQADAVVVDTEADENLPFLLGLRKCGNILVVVVANGTGLAPHGLPRLIESGGLLVLQGETIEEVGFAKATRGMLVACEVEAETRRQDDCPAFVVEAVSGNSAFGKQEGQCQVAIGRFRDGLRMRGDQWQHEGCKG